MNAYSWLIVHLGLFMQDESLEASRLAGLIELGLAEMSMGHRTEEEFRDLLEESLAVTEKV